MPIFTLWKNTRMVVLVAATAALYVAILLPFKFAVVVPGLTEIRPGAAIPVVCSLLFGPAAAWGAAIGNLVGDIFGNMLTPGSIAGFIGNFLYGLIPFLLWKLIVRGEPNLYSFKKVGTFILGCLLSAAACAVIIAFGVKYTMGAPEKIVRMLLGTIFLNNSLMSIILGGVLLTILYPAIRALGLTYDQIMAGKAATERDLDDQPAPTEHLEA